MFRRKKSAGDRVIDATADVAGAAAGRLIPGAVRAGVRGASVSAAKRSMIYRATGLTATTVLIIFTLGFVAGRLTARRHEDE
jgi:hypothetical protein